MNTVGGIFFYVLLRILLFFDGLEDFTMKINWIARIKNKSFWVFQFTPLREGRLKSLASACSATVFQFTPLREGRQNIL